MDAAWLERYSRQILLKEVGGQGQNRLNHATVGVVGTGPMGTPAILYLAAAGIGHLVILDTARGETLCAEVQDLNPLVKTTLLCPPLAPEQAAAHMIAWDLTVLLGVDAATRQLFNRAALQTGKPILCGWPIGSAYGMAAARASRDPDAPCLLCAEQVCATAWVAPTPDPILTRMGAGVIGSVLAMEAIKSLLDTPNGLWYSAQVFYPEEGRYHAMPVPKNPVCLACCGHPK
ncbi:MAG: ThiF family adenylyltransferase [Magnetococcales bacterium]|nr:ThiF family adenylyltransferase [Magnetococcales bacterium]